MKKYFPSLQYANVPNIITTFGLFFGIAACYFLVVERDLRSAIILLSVSMLMDLVDGLLAAKLKQQTLFGQYLDSLVDFFICCIVPVMAVYVFLEPNILTFIAAGFASACGLWRLAYFNVTAQEKRNYFTGMPVPGGALLTSMSIWLVVYYGFPAWICTLAFFLAGLMMTSYFKLEKYGIWQKALWGVGVAFVITVIVL